LVASTRREWTGSQCLAEGDPEVMNIVHKEKARQKTGLELIASEVLLWLVVVIIYAKDIIFCPSCLCVLSIIQKVICMTAFDREGFTGKRKN